MLKICCNYIAIVAPKVSKTSNNVIVTCFDYQTLKKQFTTIKTHHEPFSTSKDQKYMWLMQVEHIQPKFFALTEPEVLQQFFFGMGRQSLGIIYMPIFATKLIPQESLMVKNYWSQTTWRPPQNPYVWHDLLETC